MRVCNKTSASFTVHCSRLHFSSACLHTVKGHGTTIRDGMLGNDCVFVILSNYTSHWENNNTRNGSAWKQVFSAPQGDEVTEQLFGSVQSSVSQVQSVLLTPLSNSRVPCSFMQCLHVLARVGLPQVLQFPPAVQKHCLLGGLGSHMDVDTRCLVMTASL